MRKFLFRLLVVIFAGILIFAGVNIALIYHGYYAGEKLYTKMADDYTKQADESDGVHPPIEIDFDKLLKQNKDIVGWIYCEDSIINYPIVQTDDNDFYLHKTIDKEYNFNGSIFVDCHNQRDFQDANTIIYGHNMKNGTMFAELSEFADPSYYKKHPVMWLLTPTQNYQIVLFSGYETNATSDTYTIFPELCPELKDYIDACVKQSDFKPKNIPTGKGKLVVLSTCSYSFDNARYVLHGALIPVQDGLENSKKKSKR